MSPNLYTATLSLLLERQRSRDLAIPFSDDKLLRNLSQLCPDAQRSQALDEYEADERDRQWNTLMSMMDPQKKEKFAPKKTEEQSPEVGPSRSGSVTPSGMRTDTGAPGAKHDANKQASYMRERAIENEIDDMPYRDDIQQSAMQSELLWQEQDAHLSQLSRSIGRTHEISREMGSELELHNMVLDDLGGDLDRTDTAIRRASRMMGRIGEDKQSMMLGVIILLLVILVVIYKL